MAEVYKRLKVSEYVLYVVCVRDAHARRQRFNENGFDSQIVQYSAPLQMPKRAALKSNENTHTHIRSTGA